MRSGLCALALAATLLAAPACSASGTPATTHALRSGLFLARVTTIPTGRSSAVLPEQLTITIDLRTGRYRVLSVTHPDFGLLHVLRWLTVFDGSSAIQGTVGAHGVVDGSLIRGSRGFVASYAAPVEVGVVSAFLEGRAPPAGESIRSGSDPWRFVAVTPMTRVTGGIVRLRPSRAAEAFTLPRIRPAETVQQVRAGAAPAPGVVGFWLGPEWRGRAPLYASQSVYAARGAAPGYSISYPGLEIDVQRGGLFRYALRRTTRLPGLGPVAVERGLVGRSGQVNIQSPPSTTTPAAGTGNEVATAVASDLFVLGSAGGSPIRPGQMVVMIYGRRMWITLSGAGVTRATLPGILRSLRPV